MGTRIHKKMGWLYNYNPKKFNTQDCSEILNKCSLKDFQNYLVTLPNSKDILFNLKIEIQESKKIKLSSKLSEIITIIDNHDEYKNGIIFSSIMCHETWNRYDDPIDYIEATTGEYKVNYLSGHELFPYYQPFVVSSNLKELDRIKKEQLRIFSHTRHDFTSDFKKELQDLGMNLKKDFKKQIHMIAPDIIRELFNFVHLKLDIKDQDYQQMKPAIVTFWS